MNNNPFLYYVNQGLSVFPVALKSKASLVNWKRFQSELPTEDEILFWERQYPDANVAIVTGETSGLLVLDVDGEGGLESLKALGELPRTPTVKTGKGFHYYFKHPGFRVKNRTNLLPKIDIRGDGGCAIAPPSLHPNGARYSWIVGLDVPLADIPYALLEFIEQDGLILTHNDVDRSEEEFGGPDRAKLQSAMDAIPSEDREDWIKVGMALHHEFCGSDHGYVRWDDWSRTSAKYDPVDQERQWASFGSNNETAITSRTIYWLARKAGWQWAPNFDPPSTSIIPGSKELEGAHLTDLTMAGLTETFRRFGHEPSTAQMQGLRDLASHLEATANGTAEPLYYLSSLDPGVGKTQTIVHFTKALLNSAEHKHVGEIVLVGRLKEIDAFIENMDLDSTDYASITSDNDKPAGNPDPCKAQVLFATQQMLESRVKKHGHFAAISEFHYNGMPRHVRIWDEACLPARTLTINVTMIEAMTEEASRLNPPLYKSLDKLIADIKGAPNGGLLLIPDFAAHTDIHDALDIYRDDKRKVQLAVKDLWILSGRTAVVRQSGRNNTVVHYENTLPDDLKPIVICDASGRVRQTYPHWSNGRGDLVQLQTGTKDYSDLTVHVWRRAGSKDAWFHHYPVLFDGMINTIHGKPDDTKWLIIHHKRSKYFPINVPASIRERTRNPERLYFTHWLGEDYRATNQYKDIDHIILAGTLFYDDPTYESLARLSRGAASDEQIDPGLLREIRRGEHAHLILQALCRGSVRKSRGSGCHPCNAFIIAGPQSGIPQMLQNGSIFPAAKVVDWCPVTKEFPTKVKQAFDYLTQLLQGYGDSVTFAEAMRAIEVNNRGNFSSSIVDYPGFCDELAKKGIRVVRKRGRGGAFFTKEETGCMISEDPPFDCATVNDVMGSYNNSYREAVQHYQSVEQTETAPQDLSRFTSKKSKRPSCVAQGITENNQMCQKKVKRYSEYTKEEEDRVMEIWVAELEPQIRGRTGR
jgi:hypothetical protein